MIDQIIGIDCATDSRRVGLAAARHDGAGYRLKNATLCPQGSTPVDLVAAWCKEERGRTLLALDAPLGWPAALASELSQHAAGQIISTHANQLFRRQTDRAIARTHGKTPLDVGADRIARTAHWALSLLGQLRRLLESEIPLAWSSDYQEKLAAIEVYPAATLLAHAVDIRGYKARDGMQRRSAVFSHLAKCLDCTGIEDPTQWSVDVLDATVCVLAGLDFARGEARGPDEPSLAAKEGWIWARPLLTDASRKATSGPSSS